MEPRPRGLGPDVITRARGEYVPCPDFNMFETNFSRGDELLTAIDTVLSDGIQKPHVLLVGAGMETSRYLCSYLPFRIAAHFDAKKEDYKLTVVDKEPKVIADIRRRKNLYLSEDGPNEAWDKYLRDTGYVEQHVFERRDDLVFIAESENSVVPPSYLLKRGIRTAAIPNSFQTKLQDGSIDLVNGDIATAEHSLHDTYNVIDCTNVLYLLPQSGQQLAFDLMARKLAPNGYLLINDIPAISMDPQRVFASNEGWLTDTLIQESGLVVVERHDTTIVNTMTSCVLQKTA